MESLMTVLTDVAIIVLILVGVRQFRTPHGAIHGNLTAALALGLAIVAVVMRHTVVSPVLVALLLAVGGALGWWLALRVSMIQTPAMVALQHGAGAVAAFLVCVIELVREAGPGVSVNEISGLTGLVLGAATFSASLMASGKLANLLRQAPTQLRAHNLWLLLVLALIAVAATLAAGTISVVPLLVAIIALSAVLGLLVAMRVGGADMPVLISFLNAAAGLAAAFAGVVIENQLLVAAGATVAASGSVLTIAMVRAMNRSLLAVFRGFKPAAAASAHSAQPAAHAAPADAGEAEAAAAEGEVEVEAAAATSPAVDPLTAAREACSAARSVIIIPGYGMAMAQAQFEVVELAQLLEQGGAQVRFAIHPVAGRMPGHMHVLLSEADAPWDQLCEMPQINPDFPNTDLAIVVGASDVVNPAAMETTGTPISGMPILKAQEAKQVIVINLDDRPGYSGVHNTLYDRPDSILLWGDAKGTLRTLIDAIRNGAAAVAAGAAGAE